MTLWTMVRGVAVVLCVLKTGMAFGQPAPTPTHLDAADVFEAASRAAAAGRPHEALELYDAMTRDHDLEVRSEARFRKGQLLAAQGRFRDAALVYRQLLDEKPDAARVRIELALMLAKIGDEPGARRQLRLAQSGRLPPDVAAQLVQFSRALRTSKRFGGTINVALAPDTNINRGTQARSLDTVIAPLILSDDARVTSGVGLRVRSSGFAKLPLFDNFSLVVRAALSADVYRQKSAEDISATVSSGVEWQNVKDRIGLSYGAGKRWYGGSAYNNSRSATVEWLHSLSPTTQLSATIARTNIRYRQNPLQDGAVYDASGSIEHAFAPTKGAALGVNISRQRAVDPSYASWAAGPFAYGWFDAGPTTVFAAANLRRLLADQRNFLFADKRAEWFFAGHVGMIAKKIVFRGFSPLVRLGMERNSSTVSIFDYRRLYGEVGLSRTF